MHVFILLVSMMPSADPWESARKPSVDVWSVARKPIVPKPIKTGCRCEHEDKCGCEPGSCTCLGGRCECIDCGWFVSRDAYWAPDEAGGHDLCDQGRVIGYLWPSGRFKRRYLKTNTWSPYCEPPIPVPQKMSLAPAIVPPFMFGGAGGCRT